MMRTVRHVAACDCLLGEGPLWLPQTQELAFVDIIGKSLLFWNAKTGLRRVPVGQKIGSIALLPGGGFLAASERGLFKIDASTGKIASIGHDQIIPKDTLMNDGKCDRAGRFAFGSKAVDEQGMTGALMVFDGQEIKDLDRVCILNGPAFCPTGDRIYFADSPARKIFTAPYDLANGAIGKVEVFATLPKGAGYPDGMTVDAQGCLWNAHWDGWRILRYGPDGIVKEEIEMPISRPTSLAFGGADMGTLFVTSAKQGVESAPLARETGAGDLFAIDLDVSGLPEPEFTGEIHV